MSDTLFVVLSTFADEESARSVSRVLVEEGLVACAQVESRPIRSIYRWKGEVQEEDEVLVRFKTTPGARDRLADRLRALHPYEVPQIVWTEAGADAAYAAWARVQCGEGGA